MLTLTMDASVAVASIVARADGDAAGGLRIADDPAGSESFALTVAPAPEQTDTVVVEGGARVFLDERAATVLDDKVLDAQVGEDGAVRFALAEQAA